MKRRVLIADGNSARARLLADACGSAGVECTAAPDGAAALERALAQPPALVVAQLDLPLVDGLKLAEILRANPRTRSARFLFLGEPTSPAQVAEVAALGDMQLPGAARGEAVVAAVEQLIQKQERIDGVTSATGAGGEVGGDLAELALIDLLQLFLTNKTSGQLVLEHIGLAGDQEERVHSKMIENFPAALVIYPAHIGEAYCAGRPMQQSCGEPVFEPHYLATDEGGRDLQRVSGSRKATVLHHGNKFLEAGRYHLLEDGQYALFAGR